MEYVYVEVAGEYESVTGVLKLLYTRVNGRRAVYCQELSDWGCLLSVTVR